VEEICDSGGALLCCCAALPCCPLPASLF
jgi:hypothetical protein